MYRWALRFQELIRSSVHKMKSLQTTENWENWWRLMCWWNETVMKQAFLCPSYTVQKTATSQFSSEGTKALDVYVKTPKHLCTVNTNKCASKTEGLAHSVLNIVVTTFMDRVACLDSILVYIQIHNQSRGRWILTLSPLTNKKNLIWH